MAFPNAQPTMFARDSGFTLGEILKIVQENGSDPLYAELDPFDKWISKRAEIDWGQDHRWNLNVDPGGGSIGRLAAQGGRFAPGDRTHNIIGTISPKLQTITYQFERYLRHLSGNDTAAYIENAEQEYNAKNSLHKSELASQQLGDGTGRKATPASFGVTGVSTGANFTVATPDEPLRINLSTLDTSAGSVASCYEGLVISFLYRDNISDARLASLSATDAGTGTTVVYDAFRVVEVDQDNNCLLVFPARQGTVVTDMGTYVQGSRWISGAASGVVTFVPLKGLRPEMPAADAVFGDPTGAGAGTAVESLLGTATLLHPLYINQSQASALLQLGIGWTSATDLSFLHDGVWTGFEALLVNKTNTVHGINRSAIRQYLPSVKENGGRNLTFNTLFSFLSQHYNRNRVMPETPAFTGVLMNPLVYSSMVSMSEMDKRITDGSGVRGEQGSKLIKFGDKSYQLETHSSMRHDRVFAIPAGETELLGGSIESVTAGGQAEFLQLDAGRRVNVLEAYSTVVGEQRIKTPRRFGVIRDFSFNRY